MTPEESLRDILANGKLLSLSTTTENGDSRTIQVWYASDENLSIYFISNKNRDHSLNILHRPDVSGALTSIHLEGLGQKVRGLSFHGKASEVDSAELHRAHSIYAKKWDAANNMFYNSFFSLGKMVKFTSDMRYYRIDPSQYILFDETLKLKNPRVIIPM